MATVIIPTPQPQTDRRPEGPAASTGRSRMIEAFYIAEARAYLAHQHGAPVRRTRGSAR